MERPNHYQTEVRERESAVGLLRRLVDEFTVLFRKEIALAKAEVAQGFSQVKAGAISLASGVRCFSQASLYCLRQRCSASRMLCQTGLLP